MPHLPRSLPQSSGIPTEILAALDKQKSPPQQELDETPRRRIGMPRISLRNHTVDPLKVAKQILGKDFVVDERTRGLVPGSTGKP